jgi:quercetin dioxygenase-like cupin family protein
MSCKEETMKNTIASHAAFGGATALLASFLTWFALAPGSIWTQAHAQQPAATGVKQTEVFKTTMNDVLGRVLSVRVLERDAGTGSPAHRHPGSHTVGYVLEGSYEVKIDDGPVRKLGPGEAFYEAPNALHAVSRNGSKAAPVKYLVIQVSDPTKPATVPE